MSGVGFWELIFLFLIGLIVLGPERLPRVAQQLGGWLGQARRMTRVMKRQLEDELDLNKPLNIQPPKTKMAKPAAEPPSAATSANKEDDLVTGGDAGSEKTVTDEDSDSTSSKAAHGE